MLDTSKLLALMKERGMTQKSLEEAAGISRPAVTKLLNQYGDVKLATVQAIAKALMLTETQICSIFFSPDG